MPDPKAPASSSRHPRNGRRQLTREREALEQTHLTEGEREAGAQPSLAELRARRTLLIRYLEQRDLDDENERTGLPVIADATGAEVVLAVSDDGKEASWQPYEPQQPETPDVSDEAASDDDSPADDTEDGDDADDEEQAAHYDEDGKPDQFSALTRRELRPLLREAGLPVGGNRDDMIKRLREHQAAK